jgi:hypothetical protein
MEAGQSRQRMPETQQRMPGLDMAGHLRPPAGRGGLGRSSLEHDRPGHAPPCLGLTMEATGSAWARSRESMAAPQAMS